MRPWEPAQTWRAVSADVFAVVDGKKLLFEGATSLFKRLRNGTPPVDVIREVVAGNMTPDEIHEDVWRFFDRLKQCTDDIASTEGGHVGSGEGDGS